PYGNYSGVFRYFFGTFPVFSWQKTPIDSQASTPPHGAYWSYIMDLPLQRKQFTECFHVVCCHRNDWAFTFFHTEARSLHVCIDVTTRNCFESVTFFGHKECLVRVGVNPPVHHDNAICPVFFCQLPVGLQARVNIK